MSVSKALDAVAGIVGGYAALDSGLLVPRTYLPQIAGLLHEMAKTTAPAVTDDSGDGYGVGSRWLDTTNDREYVCLDATVGAAVWHQTTVTSVWTTYTPAWTSSGTAPAIVNGVLAGWYRYLGPKTVDVIIQWRAGSSTTFGTGIYYLSLPFAADTSRATAAIYSTAMPAILIDSGTRYWSGVTVIRSAATTINVIGSWPTTGEWSQNVPMTMAVNDELVIHGSYELA